MVTVKALGHEGDEERSIPEVPQQAELLGDLDMNPETVVVKLGESIVPEKAKLSDGDE